MEIILRIIGHILNYIRYFLWVLILVLIIGILGILFGGQRRDWTFIFDYGEYSVKTSVFFPLISLLLVIILIVFIERLLKIWSKLLFLFGNGEYFKEENISLLKKSVIFLTLITVIQFVLNIVFNIFSVENTSNIFDFSIKSYLGPIIMLILNLMFIVLLKNGQKLKKENEEFI